LRALGVEAVKRLLARSEGAGGEPRVLPPMLRKPARFLSRLEWRSPRHAGTKGASLLFLATALTGMIAGNHTSTVLSAVTAASGLAIDNIAITGQSETSEVDVLTALDIGTYPSLFTFDVDAARARVEALPWVAQATLKKLYPGTLEVAVIERLPYALWQQGTTVALIDPQGTVITTEIGERYRNLPLVVGPGANTRVDEFLDLIVDHPDFIKHVRAGVLVSERRWNIVLSEAVEILLPEVEPKAALDRLVDIDDRSQLLARDIAAVDLRLPDRMVVRLTDKAHLVRQDVIKEREKLAKKMGTDT
jgi:cell division protein FtsQ